MFDRRFPEPESLNIPIADKAEIVRFESRYEVGQLIPCCIASCHQPHKRGIIVSLTSGELSRIGHDCGEVLLGTQRFTDMKRDYDEREQRALRLRYISSPRFDPADALIRLRTWEDRVRLIQNYRKLIEQHEPRLLRDIQIAIEKQNGWFELRNEQGILRKVKFGTAKFLSTKWEHLFLDAKIDVANICLVLRKDILSDAELKDVVSKAGEAQRRLKIVSDIIDPFVRFQKDINHLLDLNPPDPLEPLDRSPIEKLAAGGFQLSNAATAS